MIFFWGLLVAAVASLCLVAWLMLHRRLHRSLKERYRKQWEVAIAFTDPARRVLETEKVLDGVLSSLGYEGSLADKLKRAGARLPDVEAVWAAHKLRNRIAHEPGVSVTEKEAQSAIGAFAQAIKKFL